MSKKLPDRHGFTSLPLVIGFLFDDPLCAQAATLDMNAIARTMTINSYMLSLMSSHPSTMLCLFTATSNPHWIQRRVLVLVSRRQTFRAAALIFQAVNAGSLDLQACAPSAS